MFKYGVTGHQKQYRSPPDPATRTDRCVAGRRARRSSRRNVMIEKLHEAGLRSEHAYIAGFASIGLSFLAWATSLTAEKAGTDRADRWGIFVGHWAPTFFGLGNALRTYEKT
jgi:hypothetical protein